MMLTCRRTQDIRPAIAIAFDADYVGYEKYRDPISRIQINSIEDVVNDTIIKLNEFVRAGIGLIYFEVQQSNKVVGFFCCFWDYKNAMYCLVSFGLNKNYRQRALLDEYFKLLKKTMMVNFYTVLFSKNTRAINWLKKNEMVEIESDQKDSVILKTY